MTGNEQFIQRAQLHMDEIFRLAFSCLKSKADADDVTQTVLLRLYESKKAFESEDHLNARNTGARHGVVRKIFQITLAL